LTYSGWLSHILVTNQLQSSEDREVRRPRDDVLPLFHVTKTISNGRQSHKEQRGLENDGLENDCITYQKQMVKVIYN